MLYVLTTRPFSFFAFKVFEGKRCAWFQFVLQFLQTSSFVEKSFCIFMLMEFWNPWALCVCHVWSFRGHALKKCFPAWNPLKCFKYQWSTLHLKVCLCRLRWVVKQIWIQRISRQIMIRIQNKVLSRQILLSLSVSLSLP